MANPNIYYATNNFEYLTLTQIHGMPSYKSLRKIKNELKYNVASIPFDLCSEANGYSGSVIMVAKYENITPASYVCPVHPGILNISVGTPNYEAKRLTEEHKELVRLNREANNVDFFTETAQ